MKRLFATLTLAVILLTGCAVPNEVPDVQTSDTEQTQVNTDSAISTEPEDDAEPELIARFEFNEIFQNLLDEVNAEHAAIKMYDGDYEQYIVQNEEPGFVIEDYAPASTKLPLGTTVLTLDQVKEDLEFCYKALRTKYGCYEYFGGDEVFRPVIDAIIADCANMDTITFAKLHHCMREHFAFVEDNHFTIDGTVLEGNAYTVPIFFRDIFCTKTENGYETVDGKIVVSVNGYDDLDALFKLSLTTEGELAYSPVLLEPSKSIDIYYQLMKYLNKRFVITNDTVSIAILVAYNYSMYLTFEKRYHMVDFPPVGLVLPGTQEASYV